MGAADPLATVELIRSIDPKDKELEGKSPQVLRTTADQTGKFAFNLTSALKAAEDLEFRQITDGKSSDSIHEQVTPYYRNGEELRAILGYQQAGASAAKAEQNWFLDFFISRPLAFRTGTNDGEVAKWRWWGNVRVASYPQQGDVPVATFASSFVTQFGQLKVNQLAQSAEFLTGLEYNLLSGRFSFLGKSEDTRQHYTLGLIGGGGATGPMNPTSSLSVFDVPSSSSPQFPAFQREFPGVTSKFIGFVSPDRDNFLSQYLVGFRLTTTYLDKDSFAPLLAAPAIVAISVGQNQVVTGGQFHGVVLRTEGFYPLPFFNRVQDRRGMLSAIYLFGTSQMHLGALHNRTPLILASETGIAGSDPNVTIVSSPSNRDVYRIGVGIDLVNAIMSLTHPATTAQQQGSPTGANK